MSGDARDQSLPGALAALAAFSLWGVFPVYFKAVAHLPLAEVISHRVVWTTVFVGLLVLFGGRLRNLRRVLADGKLLRTLFLSSLLVSTNWLIFIWAVAHDRVLESSLGYFINPLVSVALGLLFLKEKLSLRQGLAVGLATIAVGILIVRHGAVPWVALSLAFSFGFYGLIRKLAAVDAYTGLFVEVALITPPVLAYLIYLGVEGNGVFTLGRPDTAGLLILAGLMTATPLVLFALAAKRLRLSTVGFFQYIAPTGHFLLAVFVYGEPFTDALQWTFGLIWLALAIYSLDGVFARRKN